MDCSGNVQGYEKENENSFELRRDPVGIESLIRFLASDVILPRKARSIHTSTPVPETDTGRWVENT
jgi:hypothetical protein